MEALQQTNLTRRPPIELTASERTLLWAAIAAAAGLFGGLIELRTNPIFAVFGLAVMGVGLWAIWKSSLEGASYLALDADGFTLSIRFKKQVVRWTDVKAIRIGWIGVETVQMPFNRQVFIDRADRSNALPIFPHFFGCNAEELVAVMTPYLEDARRAQQLSSAQSAPSMAPETQSPDRRQIETELR